MKTTMTSDELKNYVTHFYDEKGEPIIAQLDLRNEVLRDFYERLMEDLGDILDSIEALKEENGKRYSLEEIEEELLSSQPSE